MAGTMKAAVVHGFGRPLSIERVPIPEPRRGVILVKVEACGVCHTDLHAADGDWPVKPSLPFIPGHEVTGTVAALGSDATELTSGDPVGVAWLHDACSHPVCGTNTKEVAMTSMRDGLGRPDLSAVSSLLLIPLGILTVAVWSFVGR